MQTIHIKVDKKFATCTEEAIVANNTDWRVEFNLDSEWDDIDVKYCRFYYNDYHYDKQFVGTTCQAPLIHEHEENDGPEPYFIGIGLFSCNPNMDDTYGDFLVTNMVYIKCIPSVKETGYPGEFSTTFQNKLFMRKEKMIGSFNAGWQASWESSDEGSLEIGSTMGEKSIFNEVVINLNTRELQTITVPFVITNEDDTEILDEEWGKDYLFSYVLDYGYNCAFWWTYEIDGKAYWKSPLVTTLDNGGRLSRQALEMTALQPTNIPKYKKKKELKLHIIATFGDNLMVGGKLRFVNVKVQEQEDAQDYTPHNITQDNYISTHSFSSALHKWKLGRHTILCSSLQNESDWVLINPFYYQSESSQLIHYIYPSIGNSLFPQNNQDIEEWHLKGRIINTSIKQDIYVSLTGYYNDTPYFLFRKNTPMALQKTDTEMDMLLNFDQVWSQGQWVPLPEKFDYIKLQIDGGNDGNNTVLIENLRLVNVTKQGQVAIECIDNIQTPSSVTQEEQEYTNFGNAAISGA